MARNNAGHITNKQKNFNRQQAILEWLSPNDYSRKQRDFVNQRQKGGLVVGFFGLLSFKSRLQVRSRPNFVLGFS